MAKGVHVNHEPGRWSLTGSEIAPPQQLHLVSQGYPVRIRRALVAGGLALAVAVGGTLAASLASGGTVPTSEQSDAGVSSTVGLGS
jgi:hypothetical protein